jgi:hypothetical protein
MNRYLNQFFYSFFKKAVLISGKIPLSAAAAVGTVAIKGIVSVAKTGTGLYTITFSDAHYALVGLSASVVDSAEDIVVDFSSVNLSAKTVVMTTKIAGVADDVSDACDVYVNFLFNDTSVQ